MRAVHQTSSLQVQLEPTKLSECPEESQPCGCGGKTGETLSHEPWAQGEGNARGGVSVFGNERKERRVPVK